MKVPGAALAIVDEGKVRGYLLARSHPQGGSKARFFVALGFRPAAWRWLAAALRAHVMEHAHERRVATEHGVKYIVRGALRAPRGKSAEMVTVWIIERGAKRPRFVTAYPGGTK
jgi:hypothetical protein